MKRKSGKVLIIILKVVGCILAFFIVTFGFLYFYIKSFVSKTQRVDDKGRLYYTEYKGNYSSALIEGPYNLLKPVRTSGCSAFYTKKPTGEYVTARNYDLAHLDKTGQTTGLNIIVKCSPKGKYKSIGVADAAMLAALGLPYCEGCFDDGKADTLFLAFLPYLCVDGINEKGLAATINALDIKEGEQAVYQIEEGKDSVIIPELLRQILDNCATVDQAVSLAEERNLINTFGADFHLFVTDAEGASAVFEWRYNTLKVTYTDIITNFYVGSDDAEDCYVDGVLKEAFVPPVINPNNYKFGFGHGYERFKTIMQQMSEHTDADGTKMTDDEALETLKAVSQEYTGELTSLTQYSVLYQNSNPSMSICSYPDYENVYIFKID